MPVRLLVLIALLAEIASIILVGRAVGVGATLALILLGILAGGYLLRWQGPATLMQVRGDMAARRMPARTLAEGALKALAAILLIMPGFLSDIVALLLLLPPVRAALWRFAERRARWATVRRAPAGSAVIDLDDSEFASSARNARTLPRDTGL
jgi:UPF0716 protein FxsA